MKNSTRLLVFSLTGLLIFIAYSLMSQVKNEPWAYILHYGYIALLLILLVFSIVMKWKARNRFQGTLALFWPPKHDHSWRRTKSGQSFYCKVCHKVIHELY
jgi:predicted tellurium resistance membrane protein TerC